MKVEHLTKQFKDTLALDDVSFEFESPSFIGVIGHNGSGKTTLLEIMMGIQKQTSGNIQYDGNLSMNEWKEQVGVVLQTNSFYDNIKVYELLRLFKSYYHSETYEIDYLIDELNIGEYKDKYYSKLSGGMKQKVNLALAFLNKPKIVFLDEPTTGLDPLARQEFWNVLNKLCKDTTLFLSSHYMEEVEKYCTGLVYLHKGKKIFSGSIKELYERENMTSLSDIYIKLSGGE